MLVRWLTVAAYSRYNIDDVLKEKTMRVGKQRTTNLKYVDDINPSKPNSSNYYTLA